PFASASLVTCPASSTPPAPPSKRVSADSPASRAMSSCSRTTRTASASSTHSSSITDAPDPSSRRKSLPTPITVSRCQHREDDLVHAVQENRTTCRRESQRHPGSLRRRSLRAGSAVARPTRHGCRRMLRAVYGLSLLAAKDISVRGDTGQDADTHQATLLPGIEQALEAEDR